MYTGIIQACLPIATLDAQTGLTRYSLIFSDELLVGLKTGASVSIDGVCQTVTQIKGNAVYFDAMAETLAITTLNALQVGVYVNVERSAKIGDENGGHAISGHVHNRAQIIEIETTTNNYRIFFKISPHWIKYIFHKGFIALNGASLTLASVDKDTRIFSVCLIPETLQRTNFQYKKIGDYVNFEIDTNTLIIVDSVESFLKQNSPELLNG